MTNKVILKSEVKMDEITAKFSSASDFIWDGKNSFTVPEFDMPKDFDIGVITGSSGTGKSSILKTLGRSETKVEWDPNKAVDYIFDAKVQNSLVSKEDLMKANNWSVTTKQPKYECHYGPAGCADPKYVTK